MKCNYPNCRNAAWWIPVVLIPTVRQGGDGKFQKTDKPTQLQCPPVCIRHRNRYSITDWIGPAEWHALEETAKDAGFDFPKAEMATVEFKPMGWTPDPRYMEVERGSQS